MRLRQIENVIWLNFEKSPPTIVPTVPTWLDYADDPIAQRGIRSPDPLRNRYVSGVMYVNGYGGKLSADKLSVESFLTIMDPLKRRELIRVLKTLKKQI